MELTGLEGAHLRVVYSWVTNHQEEVWIDALLTVLNIEQFLMMPNWLRHSSCHASRALSISRGWKRSPSPFMEGERKKSCTEGNVVSESSGSSSSTTFKQDVPFSFEGP